jgi:hypothetical protein
VGGVHVIWTACMTLLDGLSCHFTMLLEAPLCLFSLGAVCDGRWWMIFYWWSFLFFFFSFVPEKVHDYSFFIFQFQSLFFWFFIFILIHFIKVLCFQFSPSITTCYMLFVSFRSLFFWFLIFFLDPFVKVLLFSILSFNQSSYCFIFF